MTRAKCKILPFPTIRVARKRPEEAPAPDAVRMDIDFDDWCVELYAGDRRVKLDRYKDRNAAEAEIERLVAGGLRRLPQGPYLRQREALP